MTTTSLHAWERAGRLLGLLHQMLPDCSIEMGYNRLTRAFMFAFIEGSCGEVQNIPAEQFERMGVSLQKSAAMIATWWREKMLPELEVIPPGSHLANG